MCARLQGIIDDERLHALAQCCYETVMNALGDDHPRGGRAALAGREEGAVDGAVDGCLKVRIIKDDERVLAPISSCTFFMGSASMQVAATLRPVGTEPVNDTAFTCRLRRIASPTTDPRPI